MFSKLTVSLAITMSLMFASSAFAQTTKKATQKKAQTKKVEEVKAVEPAKKVEEAKPIEETKAAAKPAEETTSSNDVLGYLKSHFSASYHGEYYLTRKDPLSANEDDRELQDLKIMHNPTITYRPMTNVKFLVTSEFKYTDALSKGTYINRHYRSLVSLTRENILTEKENGIKLDLGVARRIFDRNHGKATTYGNSRFTSNLSKKFNDQLSASLFAQYMLNDPVKKSITSSTWRHSLDLIPSFTFQITEKLSYFFNDDIVINTPWYDTNDKSIEITHEMNVGVVSYQSNDANSTYFQLKYYHFPKAASFANASDDWFEYYIGHTYSFTPKVSITGEIGSRLLASKDGKSFLAEEVKYPELAIYFDMSI